MTITESIVHYAAGSRFEDLPAEVVERVKFIVFDELACAVIGRELIAGDLIARFVGRMGGLGEAAVIGSHFRAPVPFAALANGTAGHADELDGAHVTGGHPGAVIVHAATAVAEMRRSNGKALISAISLGYDIGTRLVDAAGGAFDLRNRQHVHSDHLHAFGAAISSSRLLGLDVDGIRHATALAASSCGGLAVIFEERRHMSKALSTGQAAFAGTSAALMAALGFEGHDNVFDSEHGPLSWGVEGRKEKMLKELGSDYAVMGSNFKFYSAGYPIHAPVEAALNILDKNGLETTDIDSVSVHMNTGAANTVNNREMPSICIQDMLAVAIVKGALSFDMAHSNEVLSMPEVRRLRKVIKVVVDEELDRLQPRGRGAKVVIFTKSGVQHEEWIPYPKGHALRGGVGWAELYEKWDEPLTDRLTEAKYQKFKSMCHSLESVDDLRELTTFLGREDHKCFC